MHIFLCMIEPFKPCFSCPAHQILNKLTHEAIIHAPLKLFKIKGFRTLTDEIIPPNYNCTHDPEKNACFGMEIDRILYLTLF